MDLPKEEVWKDIPRYPGYQASSFGRVRSIDRIIFLGKHPRVYKGRIKKPCLYTQKDGYRSYKTHLAVNKKIFFVGVHRLVAEAFLGPLPKGFHTMHLDGNSLNNRLENLRYGTAKENAATTVLLGRGATKGTKNHNNRLSEDDVRDVRKLLVMFNEYIIAEMYGVSRGCILGIKQNKNWTWHK